MQDSMPLLLALCGLGTVCAGTMFVALLLILRATGGNLMSFFSLLTNYSKEEERATLAPGRTTRRRPNLRAKVDALDFDNSVAVQSLEAEAEEARPAAPRAPSRSGGRASNRTPDRDDGINLPPSRFDTPADRRTQGARDRIRRRSQTNDDDTFGLLDEDGDNYPDL